MGVVVPGEKKSPIIINIKWDLGLNNNTNCIDYLTSNSKKVIVRTSLRHFVERRPPIICYGAFYPRNMEEITAENYQSLVRNTRLPSDSLNMAIPRMNQSANYWTESINLYISFFLPSVT